MAACIPNQVIAVIAKVFPDLYTATEIKMRFLAADLAVELSGTKREMTLQGLLEINKRSEHPLNSLGPLISDVLDRGGEDDSVPPRLYSPITEELLKANQLQILTALERAGISYSAGRCFERTAAPSAVTLQSRIIKDGFSAIKQEFDRANSTIDADPSAAAHYAANTLEATFKAYLSARNVAFNERADTLSQLWAATRDDLKIDKKNLTTDDLRKIATGLNSIVDGTMFIRNKKSGAHGRTEEEVKLQQIRPRHARLVVNSAFAIACYVLDCLADTPKS